MKQYYKSNPAKFFQEICGIKLSKYQELLINKLNKTDEVIFYNKSRCYGETYIKLLIQLMFMNDDDTIAIVSPDKTEILDREQFVDYIIKFRNGSLLDTKKQTQYIVCVVYNKHNI